MSIGFAVGSSENATCGTVSGLTYSSAWTLTGQLYIDDSTLGGFDQWLLAGFNTFGGDQYIYFRGGGANGLGHSSWSLYDGTTWSNGSSSPSGAGWYNFELSYNGSNTVTLKIGGSTEVTVTRTISASSTGMVVGGNSGWAYSTCHAYGFVLDQGGTVSSWPFASGSSLGTDTVGSNTLTLNNTPTDEADPAAPAADGDIAAVLPVPLAAISATAATPSVDWTGDIAAVLPVPVAAIDASNYTEVDITFEEFTWRVGYTGTRQSGTFAMGDPWIEGPVDIISITPTATTSGARLNGSMVDPDPMEVVSFNLTTGWDNRDTFHTYNDSYNVAYAIALGTPLTVNPGASTYTSIVSAQSYATPPLQSYIEAMGILTVVGSSNIPSAGDFRPWECGPTKQTGFYNTGDVVQSGLGNVALTGWDSTKVAAVVETVRRFGGGNENGWPNRMMIPASGRPDYYRDFNLQMSEAMVLASSTQKTDALVYGITQRGIDDYGAWAQGCIWGGAQVGHASGRLWTMQFAALVLGDTNLSDPATTSPSDIAELCQTFYVEETSSGVYNGGVGGYTVAELGMAEWGNAHCQSYGSGDAYPDNVLWEDNPYRRCCSTIGWVGMALAARLCGFEATIAHPELWDYVERYVDTQRTLYSGDLLPSSYVLDAFDSFWIITTAKDADVSAVLPLPIAAIAATAIGVKTADIDAELPVPVAAIASQRGCQVDIDATLPVPVAQVRNQSSGPFILLLIAF